jgi:hypothetical protein
MVVTASEAYLAAVEAFPGHDGKRFGVFGGSDVGWRVVLTDAEGGVLMVVLVDADGSAEEESPEANQVTGAVGISEA